MTPRLRALAVLGLLGAIPAGGAAAAESRDFSRPGRHPVGVRTLVLTDASRHDETSGGPRTLLTEVWYPATEAARSGKPVTFTEFFGEHKDAARRFVEHFGGKLDEVERRFRSVAVRDAPRAAGRFPLLVFSHGNGGVRHQNVFQVEHLASHGYVVASADHTGNAGVTPLPGRAIPYDRKGRSSSARDRPLDVSFIISRLLEESSGPTSWLSGALDPASIGVLGHSFGGFTACKVAESDPRVKAILPMTAAFGKTTEVPVLVMLAGWDRTLGETGNAASRLYYRTSRGPRHLVELKRAGHFSFTDMDAISPEFGDGIGVDSETGEAFVAAGVAKRTINAYSLAFFDRYLRGDTEAGDFLARPVDSAEVLAAASNGGSLEAASPAPRPAGAERQAPAEGKRALIVTGDDVPAHDWRRTTPVTRRILEAAGFEVRVAEDPHILETSALERYDLLVLNYRSPPARHPGPRARECLERFLQGGKGLVILHFAVFAYPEWKGFRDIAGRVWVSRRGGEKVSGHPPRGRFPVRVVDREHPVSAGLEDFEADDELYSRLEGEAEVTVLLDAYSAYSGRREPLAWTLEAGGGRVFVTVLGHDARARQASAFERLLEQGARWAAGL